MAGKGTNLTEEAKVYVVQALACFDYPSAVATAVKAEFGLSITKQAVEAYDPTKRAGAKVSEKWKALYEETRRTFLEDTSRIGISHRTVRLRALQRMAERAETQGNIVVAASLHKQAAEEMGNAYTNRRELTGADGGPIPISSKVDVSGLTAEQLRALASVKLPTDT